MPWVKFPELTEDSPKPIILTLFPGDVLYLPSLWYHQVNQKEEQLEEFSAAIAINYWYDMDFDNGRFSWFNFLKNIKEYVELKEEKQGMEQKSYLS